MSKFGRESGKKLLTTILQLHILKDQELRNLPNSAPCLTQRVYTTCNAARSNGYTKSHMRQISGTFSVLAHRIHSVVEEAKYVCACVCT